MKNTKVIEAQTQMIHEVRRTITIGRDQEMLFYYCRDIHNLAKVMGHFAQVRAGGEGRFYWKIPKVMGTGLEWNSRLSEQGLEELRWETVGSERIPIIITMRFRPAPAFLGTEVTLIINYIQPENFISKTMAKLSGFVPEVFAFKALRRLKSLVETGEIPSIEFNSSGRNKLPDQVMREQQ